MTEWREVKLKDVAKFSQGKQIPVEEQYLLPDKDFVRFIRIVDYTNPKEPPRYVKEQGDAYRVNSQDIVMIRYGSQTAGKVVRGISGIIANNMFKIETDDKNINVDFAYYFLSAKDVYNTLMGTQSSSTMPAITFDMIGNVLFSLPPIDVQRKIAGVLGALDDKIELNNKINNNLEQQAQALFKSWFVDKENSERKTIKAEEFFDISIGKTPPRKEPEWFTNNSDDIVWISISDMGSCGTFISNSSEYLVKEAISKFNIKIVPDNTVLLSFKLTVGRIAITDGEMTTNEAIAHFVTDKTEVNEYLYCYLKNFNFQTMGSTSSIATAVNSKIIKSMPFVLPTEKELTDFHVVTYPMFRQIKANQRENTRLAAIRDALLPKLMSGEIDVSNVDIDSITSADKLSFNKE